MKNGFLSKPSQPTEYNTMLLVKGITGQLSIERDKQTGYYLLSYIYKNEENSKDKFLTSFKNKPDKNDVRNFILNFVEINIQNAYNPVTYRGDKKTTKQHLKKERANFYRFLLRMAQKL